MRTSGLFSFVADLHGARVFFSDLQMEKCERLISGCHFVFVPSGHPVKNPFSM